MVVDHEAIAELLFTKMQATATAKAAAPAQITFMNLAKVDDAATTPSSGEWDPNFSVRVASVSKQLELADLRRRGEQKPDDEDEFVRVFHRDPGAEAADAVRALAGGLPAETLEEALQHVKLGWADLDADEGGPAGHGAAGCLQKAAELRLRPRRADEIDYVADMAGGVTIAQFASFDFDIGRATRPVHDAWDDVRGQCNYTGDGGHCTEGSGEYEYKFESGYTAGAFEGTEYVQTDFMDSPDYSTWSDSYPYIDDENVTVTSGSDQHCDFDADQAERLGRRSSRQWDPGGGAAGELDRRRRGPCWEIDEDGVESVEAAHYEQATSWYEPMVVNAKLTSVYEGRLYSVRRARTRGREAILDSGADATVAGGSGAGTGGRQLHAVNIQGCNSKAAAWMYGGVPVTREVLVGDRRAECTTAANVVFSDQYEGAPLVSLLQEVDEINAELYVGRSGISYSIEVDGGDGPRRVGVPIRRVGNTLRIPFAVGETTQGTEDCFRMDTGSSGVNVKLVDSKRTCFGAHQAMGAEATTTELGVTVHVRRARRKVSMAVDSLQQMFLHRTCEVVELAAAKIPGLEVTEEDRGRWQRPSESRLMGQHPRHSRNSERAPVPGGLAVGEEWSWDWKGGGKTLPKNPWNYSMVLVGHEGVSKAIFPKVCKGKGDAAGKAHIPQTTLYVRSYGGASAGRAIVDPEFDVQTWRTVFHKANLAIKPTPPRAQDKNPAEAAIRQLFTDARAVRHGARLPPFFWPFAVMYASVMGMLLPTAAEAKKAGGKTKLEVWSGGRITVDPRNLLPFGAIGMVTYLPIFLTGGKYQSAQTFRSVKAWFLGWSTPVASPCMVWGRPVVRVGAEGKQTLGIQIIHSVDFTWLPEATVDRVLAFDMLQRQIDRVHPRVVDSADDIYGQHCWFPANQSPAHFESLDKRSEVVFETLLDVPDKVASNEAGFYTASHTVAQEEVAPATTSDEIFMLVPGPVEKVAPRSEAGYAKEPTPPGMGGDCGGGTRSTEDRARAEGAPAAAAADTPPPAVAPVEPVPPAPGETSSGADSTNAPDARTSEKASPRRSTRARATAKVYDPATGGSTGRDGRTNRRVGIAEQRGSAKGWRQLGRRGVEKLYRKGMAFLRIYAVLTVLTAADRTLTGSNAEPTYDQAMSSPLRGSWIGAMDEELKKQFEAGAYHWVPHSEYSGKFLIPMSWRLNVKLNADGSVKGFKARAYCGGHLQRKGEHYQETFSPCATIFVVRLVMALATIYDWELHHWDLTAAFLQSDLSEDDPDIYLLPPRGVKIPRGPDGRPMRLKLTRPLYGLKQSSLRLWQKLHGWFDERGFVSCLSDTCLMIKRVPGGFVMVLTWIDDILVVSNKLKFVNELEREFFDTDAGGFKGTSEGPANHYVGIGIQRDREKRVMELTQRNLCDKVFEAAHIDTEHPPKDKGLGAKGYKLPTRREQCDEEDRFQPRYEYRRVLGILLYVARVTRPDLMMVCCYLARHAADPGREHYRLLDRAVWYLYNTRELALTYSAENDTGLYLKVDAAFQDCPDSQKSTSGVLLMLAGAAIEWIAKRQSVVATSTMHSEVIALDSGMKVLVYALKIVGFIGLYCPNPIDVYEDNQSAIAFLCSPDFSLKGRVKHLRLKMAWVKETIMDGLVRLVYTKSEDNTADAMTKLLDRTTMERHRGVFMGHYPDPGRQNATTEMQDIGRNIEKEVYGARVSEVVVSVEEVGKCKALCASIVEEAEIELSRLVTHEVKRARVRSLSGR